LTLVEGIMAGRPELMDKIQWFEGDLNDAYSLEEAMDGVVEIYHAAALISFVPSQREEMFRVNGDGTANMVNMALKHGVKRFCYVSSVAALGQAVDGKVIDEENWWKRSSMDSNYAISKYSAEREVWRGMEEGLSAFIINPTIVIGPGNWRTGSSVMYPQVWNGLSFYVEGMTGFVDVRDVSTAAITLMEKGIERERYIVNEGNHTYQHIFDLIAENLGKKKASIRVSPLMSAIGWRLEAIRSFILRRQPMLTRETARSGLQVRRYSNEKIVRETGMKFISMEQSVKDACSYFLNEKGIT